MNKRDPVVLVFSLALGLTVIAAMPAGRAAVQRVTIDQETVAKRLLSDSPQERESALADVTRIEPVNRGPTVRAAMITLLERLNKRVELGRQRGLTVAEVESPEFISAVSQSVAELKDPSSIQALAGALRWFSLVQPLAEFGEQAAPAVIGVVMSPTSYYSAVDDALRVLRIMVEKQQSRPLSPGTLAQIRRAAHARLKGQQNFTTLWYAIDLAAAVSDGDLRRTLDDLANHSFEVVARGVTDPRLITQTQQRARDRLAGLPANPRPK